MFAKLLGVLFGKKFGDRFAVEAFSKIEIEGSKGIFQSKTFYGIVLVLVGWVSQALGLDFGEEIRVEIVENILVITGAIFAIYGRVVAKKDIG